jgi:hypothetical protein
LRAAATIASEYAIAEKDGNLLFRQGGADLCLANVHFIMLHDGAVCFEGSYEELRESPNAYIRLFVGWPSLTA